jgi:hypothetical protein
VWIVFNKKGAMKNYAMRGALTHPYRFCRLEFLVSGMERTSRRYHRVLIAVECRLWCSWSYWRRFWNGCSL